MIEPWQVWLADLDPVEGHEQAGQRPVVIVSSALHLRGMQGRMATVAPITSKYRAAHNRVEIRNPKGQPNWVITEQLRTVDTRRFARSTPWWTLSDPEIADVRHSLRYMVDF